MANNYMIDGKVVASPQLGGPSDSVNLVSRSYNNAFATMIMTMIALKDKPIWKYKVISDTDLSFIEGIIYPKLSAGNNSFDITWYAGGYRGWVTKKFYLGATIDKKVIATNGGIPTLYETQLDWIQIIGQLSL